MKKLLSSLFIVIGMCTAVHAATFSCGPGYILTERKNIDGIDAQECQKLWCRDLETGKPMGVGKNANSGYKSTNYPVLLESTGASIECFGERRWCAGEPVGVWNSQFGAYMRDGDSTVYRSYQKGSCFAWRLEAPKCDNGNLAVLNKKTGEWDCSGASAKANAAAARASSMRRTGAARRIIR